MQKMENLINMKKTVLRLEKDKNKAEKEQKCPNFLFHSFPYSSKTLFFTTNLLKIFYIFALLLNQYRELFKLFCYGFLKTFFMRGFSMC